MGAGASTAADAADTDDVLHDWADLEFAKEAARNDQTPGDDWTEDGHAAWWAEATAGGKKVLKSAVLARINPGRDKDTARQPFADTLFQIERAALHKVQLRPADPLIPD